MGTENELGHSCQTYRGDDVLNLLEAEDRPLTLNEIFNLSDIDLPDIKRAVNYLEIDGDVIVDREWAENWRIRLS